MNSSLYTGVLGLQNHQIRMDVIGNNIANINTYGFKRGRATFADLMSRTYFAAAAPRNGRGGINPLQVGMGMTTVAVTNIMNQGQIESTGRLTDVAINGAGWFVLNDESGDTVYTRDGTFGLDRDGTLVNANGWKIQGWTRVETTYDHDFTVDTQRPVTDINFQVGEKLGAQATNMVGLKCNLKSDSRSLIADGLDPKEGYATKDDTLVDLYKLDAGEFTPEHLGVREGDWIEVHVNASYDSSYELGTLTTASSTVTTGTVIRSGADLGTILGSNVVTTAAAQVADIGEYISITEGSDIGVYQITGAVAGVSYTLSAAMTTTDASGLDFQVLSPSTQSFSLIPSTDVPVRIHLDPAVAAAAGDLGVYINDAAMAAAPTYNATNLVRFDPDPDNDGTYELAAGTWTYDEGTGQIILGDAIQPGATVTVAYREIQTCENTMPWQADKYYYLQVTNDTDIADLETAVQIALDALDVNGTINAEVKYDTDDAKFYVYNNAVAGSLDWNDVKVDINAASGSAIRRGYILQDSTDKTVKGTRLSLVNGGLGGNMTNEVVGTIDYQTDSLELDYDEIDSSEQLYAEVLRTRLELSYNTATHDDGIAIGEWTEGFTDNGNIQMLRLTDQLSVNGTVWSRVSFFSGANNEYIITDNNGAAAPAIYFNTSDGNGNATSLGPNTNDTIVLEFRPSNVSPILLTEQTSANGPGNYTIDSTTGNISLMWSGSSGDPGRAIVVSDGAGVVQGLTGSIRITAAYTTEKRLMEAPTALMDSRWADFVQAFAEISEGGDGKARTAFNNTWSTINNKATASPSGTIKDQATSTQPTSKVSNRFYSADTHRTSLTVYDSLGDTHELQYIFTHVGSYYDTTLQERYTNQWFWRAELAYDDVFAFDSMDRIDAVATGIARLGGNLQFDQNGLLQTTKLSGNTGPIMFDASPIGLNGNSTHASDTLSIESDFDGHTGDPIDGVTEFASESTTLAYQQNGWAMGVLQTFAIDQTGIIEGRYSNNIVKPIGQLALAIFPNEEGLTKEGANTFSISANTGTPTIVPAFVGGAGSILGGSLEMSNVDIAQEFTNMIITERGFQANSRIITTSDEMLTEVINLKR